MAMDRDAQDTRDIAVETRANVLNLGKMIADFVEESRRHREKQEARHKCLESKLAAVESIVDQARGVSWVARGALGIGALALGWLGSHFPFFTLSSGPPPH